MSEEWIFDRIRKIHEEIEKAFREFEKEIFKPLFDFESKCLEPLYHIEETPNEVIVRVDLPYVKRKEDVKVTATENKIVVEAKMERKVPFDDLITYGRTSFEMYRKEIILPTPVDAKKAKAKLRGCILEIRLPKKYKVYRISVD
ncbi:MAG: Hsp20/alpha crystallin family protein [Thermoprotei archaeon]|nr:Hsp20/alpha crystallin family protein [Thermoproteales archaeon]RLE77828.1 MAG: Hsp20/alpha crystallin family protein [Thermoprotei archaeon]RLE84670.1 MAG: Hsp20/alpha crystallin family protein [Thermoprotei archaeon]